MICLNKADEGTFKHLSFNQSPPALAPSRTTRQDLNGIANLREFVAGGQDVNAGGASATGSTGEKEGPDVWNHEPWPVAAALDARRRPWLFSRLKAAVGGEDQPRLWVSSPGRLERLWSWTTWTLSVLFSAYLLSSLPPLLNPQHASPAPSAGTVADVAAASPPARLRKRSTCQTGGVDPAQYNMPLHAGAVAIILFVSTLGCAFPIMATRFPGLRIPRRFFFAIRHFGTGVLIATAFVHLLPTAFASLGNDCLSDFWTDKYQPMPGAIALAAIFLITIIEMVFHPSRHVPPPPIVSDGSAGSRDREVKGGHLCSNTSLMPFRDMGPLRGRASSMSQGLSQLDQIQLQGERNDGVPASKEEDAVAVQDSGAESLTELHLSPEMKLRKERLQCVLLEMGILFHSVFIGMALSVSIGTDFIVLLIAIIFHQTFEGLALGSRIANVDWGTRTWEPWFMAVLYGCTTPLGQALGLATHTLYSPDSEVGLIVVGVMNAISAGLLTFASLVELLSEDFLSDESWRYLRGKRRVGACILVFLGAFLMSLVGAWA
ncbi:plasma membrane zinc ion transporter [Purpureocillium lavendulum]|uniref:Plasma membrane zinc ion transporter n=1 Tax=Purpureocillium lavendulum TaxID=1247861 RepID=A0AB34FTE3_9HYPO|nr:plasma membrane zinc ion transporter [Purpureocillium lavendulum]